MAAQSFIDQVKSVFGDKNPPFLFVGSGFSIRYLNFQNFEDLLRSLSVLYLKDFTYYVMKANGDLPLVAEYMAQDFAESVYKDKMLSSFKDKYKHYFTKNNYAFKYYLSEYIEKKTQNEINSIQNEELEKLQESKIDAVITTNYDRLIESVFPDYKVFVGQRDLISNNPQFIGEIYKIHGCTTDPKTIVVTDRDYTEFSEKNTYLAAKLVTSFVERPIVFIGYSLNDRHIKNIIFDVARCLGDERINKIQKNLIFLSRSRGRGDSITKSNLPMEKFSVPITEIQTDDFGAIYEAMAQNQRKISAHLLRFFREQMYSIALSTEPSSKIKAILDDDIELSNDVQFVIGYGIFDANETRAGIVSKQTILQLALSTEKSKDLVPIVKEFIPSYLDRSSYIPIYKFLNDLSIKTKKEFIESGYYNVKHEKALSLDVSDYKDKTMFYQKKFIEIGIESFDDIFKKESNFTKCLRYLTMLPYDAMRRDRTKVLSHLQHCMSIYEEIDSSDQSLVHKLISYYDRAVYGHDFI